MDKKIYSREEVQAIANSIRVIRKSREIVITKSFDKAASRFGTDEYEALQQARRDNPSYRVVVTSDMIGSMVCITVEQFVNRTFQKVCNTLDGICFGIVILYDVRKGCISRPVWVHKSKELFCLDAFTSYYLFNFP